MATAMIKRATSVTADWDVPQGPKVVMAFIWSLLSMIQLFYVLKRLKFIPPMAARGPYIILAVITLSLALYEVLSAVLLLAPVSKDVMDGFAQFFWGVDTAFRPAVVLYLVHQRGDVLRAVNDNTTFPLSTRTWKRIMDWVLVAIASIAFMGALGAWAIWDTDYWTAYWTPSQDYDQTDHVYGIYLGLEQTSFGFLLLLCIDVVVSLTFQIIQGRGTPDPVLSWLKTIILPLFCAYLLEVGFFDVFPLVSDNYDIWVFAACNIFFDGAVRIAITTVLILTMTLPGVSWTPQQVVAPDGIPDALKESSNSTRINVGYASQKQPASYWPQPHVLPHEMPFGASHEGNPYALHAGTESTRPVVQHPVAEIYSTTPLATTQATTYQKPDTEVYSTTPRGSTHAIPYQKPVTEFHSTTPRAPTHSMPYQPLYPASTRALPYQSPPPESTRSSSYPSPSLESTRDLPYQIPLPEKAAPKQYQSAPGPTRERFTHAVLRKEKKERE